MVRGIEVTTVTTDDGADADAFATAHGVPVKVNGVTRWYFARNSSFYKFSLPLAYWLKANLARFDIVHAHALFSFAPIAAAFLARQAGVPYVLRPLGVLNRYGMTSHRPCMKRLSLALFERRLIADASAVHFTSRAEQAEAETLGIKCKGVVIPLGVDCAGRQRSQWNNPSQHARLLFLSRIDPKKNLEGLLRALSYLSVRYAGLSLDVVGTGDSDYVADLKALAAKLGIADRVRWHGYLADQAKADIMGVATALVLPSLSENFGIAVAEALAAGLPCIVSRQVGVAEEIEEAGAGVLVGIEPRSIAAGIERLLSNTGGYAEMQSAALRLAADSFSLSVMGDRLKTMYSDICRGACQKQQAAA